MNKTLSFKPIYIDAILKQEKITTTRLFDDKNLSVGDMVDFLNSETKERFATAKINKVEETSFKEMVKGVAKANEMYEQYRSYYNREIKPEDKVKWVHFELVR